jgi:hypothetical protein
MKKLMLAATCLLLAVSAKAEVDLRTLDLGLTDCDEIERLVKPRSLDVVCNVKAHEKLLDTRGTKYENIDKEEFRSAVDYRFYDTTRTQYFDSQVRTDVQYRRYLVSGKTIGYRGKVTLENEAKGIKLIIGANFTPSGQLAKVFVLERSKKAQNANEVPADLKAVYAFLEKNVIPVHEQDEFMLHYDLVRLPGQDLTYASGLMLQNLMTVAFSFEIDVYEFTFKTTPSKKTITSSMRADYGLYCWNFRKPDGSAYNPFGDDDLVAKSCKPNVEALIDVIKDSDLNYFFASVELDEEKSAYLMIPSEEDSEKFIRIYFDIEHNI